VVMTRARQHLHSDAADMPMVIPPAKPCSCRKAAQRPASRYAAAFRGRSSSAARISSLRALHPSAPAAFRQRPSAARISTPALPVHPAAPVRDFGYRNRRPASTPFNSAKRPIKIRTWARRRSLKGGLYNEFRYAAQRLPRFFE